jgi:VanZ family protein
MLTKVYRTLFWAGYLSVLATTFIPIIGSLNEINIGPESVHIRLDHLLHIAVYFLICIYFLAGIKIKLSLFNKNPLIKFILLVLFLAIITELVQLWVPERAFNVFDLLSNIAGLVAGVGVIRMAQGTERRVN